MTLASLGTAVRQWIGLDPPWWQDLPDLYAVSPRRARALGRRQKGRRPDFPAGPTGRTYEEIWASRPRQTVRDIIAFYSDLGSWPVFRQVYRHRYRGWPDVLEALPHDGVLIEYGCGVAPVTWWLAQRRRDFLPTLVDVPGQALSFALYRLARLRPTFSVGRMIVTDETLPELPTCDVAIVTEVLEHVPSPLAVMENILGALKSGGDLFEDFYAHRGAGSSADLASAAAERPRVYELILRCCAPVSGRSWNDPDGGGLRRWRRR